VKDQLKTLFVSIFFFILCLAVIMCRYGYSSLLEIEGAAPTAELRPEDETTGVAQTDEEDMGMSYEELGW
jgi:NH3-dependent NAD+ synthetase